MQHRRMALEDHRLLLIAVTVDDLFAFGDGGKRRHSDASGSEVQRFESFGGGVKLAESAIDEDEGGERVGFLRSFSLRG